MENNLDYGRLLLDRAEELRDIIYTPREPIAEGMTTQQRRQRIAYNTKNREQKRQAREQLERIQELLIEYIGAL